MPDAPRRVTILGSTGSVGCSTVDLIARHPDRFAVEALTARANVAKLAEQAVQLKAKRAVIADEAQYAALRDALAGTGIASPPASGRWSRRRACPADWVMSAIVGAAGLEPTLAAVQRGAIVALANKECLVCAGKLLMAEVRQHGATLLPVDSEHSAIFQVFDFVQAEQVEKIVLTASGGPFRTASMEEMKRVTPKAAVAHPNWSMGAKISVDSATMMNKGLELIEALPPVSGPHRPDRGRGPSAVDHPQPGLLPGRLGAGAARHARHAHADLLRPGLAAPDDHAVAATRPRAAWQVDLRSTGSRTLSGAQAGAGSLASGRGRTYNPECGQRGGGGRVPRRRDGLPRHRPQRRARLGGRPGAAAAVARRRARSRR